MQVSINLDNIPEKVDPSRANIFKKLKILACQTSIWNYFIILVVFIVFSLVLYNCKTYTGAVLIWLERQDTVIIYAVIIVLFTIVSFPISVGYIVIVIATGYFFGVSTGLTLSVIGANAGILLAHNVIKTIARQSVVTSFLRSETAVAILKVISGTSSFKIVFCARLTPIPFGLQNAIFALGNIRGTAYHTASFLGLLPGQLVGVYAGSSLRSMQDVLDNRHISAFTYLIAAGQLVLAAGLLVSIGAMARKELARAIADADSRLGIKDNKTVTMSSFSIV